MRVEYRRELAAPGAFASSVDAFRAEGARGCNVTLPFKLDAFDYCDTRSARALRAGAVNTLVFDGERCHGDNTDGVGLVRDLQALGMPMQGRRVLVLGAGGAARGILAPLLERAPERLHVANRTPERAAALAKAFADLGEVGAGGLDSVPGGFDLVLNATAASLGDALPVIADGTLSAGGAAYDLVYADEPTPFMRWARGNGAARVSDGLGMLVEQAAESFYLWTGRRPKTRPVVEALRARARA